MREEVNAYEEASHDVLARGILGGDFRRERHGDDHGSVRERGAARAGDSRRAGGESRDDPHGSGDSRGRVLRASHGEAVVRRPLLGVERLAPRRGWEKFGRGLFLAPLFCALFLAFSGEAKAHHIPGSPVIDSTTGVVKPEVWQQLIDNAIRPTTPDPVAVPQTQVDNLTFRARMAARVLPKLQVATGQIALGVGAFTIGWAIGSQVYARLLAPAGDAGGGITGQTWAHTLTAASPTHRNVQASACPTADYPNGCWVWFHFSSTWADPGEARIPPPTAPTKTGTAATLMNYLRDNQTAVAAQVGGHIVTNHRTTGSGPGGCQTTSDWGIGYPAGDTTGCLKLITNTPDQMAEKLQIEYSNATDYNNLPAPQRLSTGTYNPPSDLGTTADKQAAGELIGGATGHSPDPDIAERQRRTEEAWCIAAGLGSACDVPTPQITVPNCIGVSEAQCEALLDAALHTGTRTFVELGREGAVITQPAGAVVTQSAGAGTQIDEDAPFEGETNPDPMPIEIFNPAGNETWSMYLGRLQGAGYVGTVNTPETLDPALADPRYGPGVAIYIRIGTPTRLRIRFPVTTPVPRIWPNEEITPEVNPPGVPEIPDPTPGDGPGTSTPPGGGVPPELPGTDGCGPTIPGIDVSPMEEIDFGSKFPFGIFGWVASALAPLTATPLTPVFDVPIALPGVGNGDIHVDFSPADPYMAMIRLLASIGIAIAAVYMFATSILGFRAGNAGGGLDEEDA